MKKVISFITAVALTITLFTGFATTGFAEDATPSLSDVLSSAATSGFCFTFTGDDQSFDGTRIVSGTAEEIARLKSSTKGTLLVRYKTASTTNQAIFAAGKDYATNDYGAILANGAAGVNQIRVDYPDGMYANLSGTTAADDAWHTFVYSVDGSDPNDKTGKTVTSFDGTTTTQYPNFASWYNQNTGINDIQYLTIGGANGTLANSSNNTNFVGSIAFVAFVPQTFTQSEAAALSSATWPEETTNNLVYSAENISVASSSDAVALSDEVLSSLEGLTDATIIVGYTNTNSGIGSLISVSDSTKSNAHFHLYQSGTTLGFEFRNSDNPKYSATTAVYDGEANTVAFTADSTFGYKLFSNGNLGATLEKTGDAYQFLSSITSLDNAYLGKTNRSNDANSYPFTGTISFIEVYNNVLSDDTLIQRTAVTQKVVTKAFYNGDATGSKFFRIPFLLSTADDTLIAGCDANFGSTGDSAENIDATIRTKSNASLSAEGENWNNATVPYALHMQDYADEQGYKQYSASVIDGVIVQDTTSETNRVLIVIDLFPWNGGVFQYLNIDSEGQAHGGTARSVAYGDGFCTINGQKYLLLSSQNTKSNGINMNTNRSLFDYVADVYGEKNADGRYNVYQLSGTPSAYSTGSTPVDDSNLSLGTLSDYSLSTDYELYKNGQLQSVTQKTSDSSAASVQVPMKIFYEDSELQVYNTSYLLQVYSDDDGTTWHTDKIISGMVKRENSKFYITGPGRGLQIKAGTYAGRILVPVYYQGNTSTEVIYSDDGGETWQHGNPIPSSLALHESTLVEMPDGSLKIFVRNTTSSGGKIITATSNDGGATWHDVESALGDTGAGTNCQISAINYSTAVISAEDGQQYPAILMATTTSNARKNGQIYVGLIKPNGTYSDGNTKYLVDWEYDYQMTGTNELFAYSCLTEMSNGKIGILYESSENSSWSTGLQSMFYKELTIDQLTETPMA